MTDIIKKHKDFNYNRLTNSNVDIVYLWVTSRDKKWREKYKKYTNIDIDHSRLTDYDEIIFSLKTVDKFIPWINKIYIITDNQKPKLNKVPKKTRDKIIIIDHKEIIPKKYLPVFNSEVIQPFIWKIKNLSETLIILDDDMFFGNYINMGDIFHCNHNVPKTYWKYKRYNKEHFEKNKNVNAIQSTHRTIQLFHKKFKVLPNIRNIHVAYILSKKTLETTFKIFKKELQKTFVNRTRKDNQYKFFNLCAYVGIYYGFLKCTNPSYLNYKTYLFEGPKESKIEFEDILNSKPKFFLINRLNDKTVKYFNKLDKNYLKQFKADNSNLVKDINKKLKL